MRFSALLALVAATVLPGSTTAATDQVGWDVHSIRSDGSGRRLVVGGPQDDLFPAVSRDGRRLAFVRTAADEQQTLWVRGLGAGGQARSVGPVVADFATAGPRWSPDSRWLAFTFLAPLAECTTTGRCAVPAVGVARADGSRRSRVRSRTQDPAWSPDSRRLAAARETGGIHTFGVFGRNARALSEAGTDAAWSADGRLIAFARGVGRMRSIRVVPANGAARPRIVAFGDGEPTWSPRRRTLLYEDNGSLYRLDLGGRPQRLARGVEPAWSPRGDRIAFLQAVGTRTFLAVMRADGSALRRLTRADVYGAPPAWSPDGRRLYFAARS